MSVPTTSPVPQAGQQLTTLTAAAHYGPTGRPGTQAWTELGPAYTPNHERAPAAAPPPSVVNTCLPTNGGAASWAPSPSHHPHQAPPTASGTALGQPGGPAHYTPAGPSIGGSAHLPPAGPVPWHPTAPPQVTLAGQPTGQEATGPQAYQPLNGPAHISAAGPVTLPEHACGAAAQSGPAVPTWPAYSAPAGQTTGGGPPPNHGVPAQTVPPAMTGSWPPPGPAAAARAQPAGFQPQPAGHGVSWHDGSAAPTNAAGRRPAPPPVAAEYQPPPGTAEHGHAAPGAVERAARERGVAVDRAQDHSGVPLVSYATPPAPSLRLAGVSTGAAQDLRHRARYIAVADSFGKTEGAPATTAAYLARVAELTAHRCYHFPAAGPQLTAYLAWLLRTYGHRPLAVVQAADAKAREAMAASPRVFHTALDWELLCRPGDLPRHTDDLARQSDGRRMRSSVCQNFLAGRCPITPCPWHRAHPACRVCRLADHPTELHGEAGHRAGAPQPIGPAARERRQPLPYPPRGRGGRR